MLFVLTVFVYYHLLKYNWEKMLITLSQAWYLQIVTNLSVLLPQANQKLVAGLGIKYGFGRCVTVRQLETTRTYADYT